MKNIYNKNKIIYPFKDEKLLFSNTIQTDRQKSVKHLEKFKTSYPKEFINSSRNISKKKNLEIKEKLNHNILDKNKNGGKKSTTINNLLKKEKFIKGMKSTKYMEKIKGIQNKKQNLIITTDNPEQKLKNEYINTNIINGQRNNYIISNNFNTINSYNDKTYSEKSSSKIIEQNLSGGNNQNIFNNNNSGKWYIIKLFNDKNFFLLNNLLIYHLTELLLLNIFWLFPPEKFGSKILDEDFSE